MPHISGSTTPWVNAVASTASTAFPPASSTAVPASTAVQDQPNQRADMQPNPLRAALERGQLQIGTWVNMIRTPAILPLLKAAGLDFARIDMEHSAASIETIADMALLARALNFPIA